MGGEKHAHVLEPRHLTDRIADVLLGDDIQPDGWLIEQDQLRVEHQDLRELDELLLTERQRRRADIAVLQHPDEVEQLLRAGRLAARHPGVGEAVGQRHPAPPGGADVVVRHVQRDAAQAAEVLGGMIRAHPTQVFAEADVQLPVQAVLDGPVAAHSLGRARSRERDPRRRRARDDRLRSRVAGSRRARGGRLRAGLRGPAAPPARKGSSPGLNGPTPPRKICIRAFLYLGDREKLLTHWNQNTRELSPTSFLRCPQARRAKFL